MAAAPDREATALGADLVIPLLALGFAVYFFWSISGLVWEAKINGVMIGSVLMVLVAVQLLRIGLAVVRGRANLRTDALWQPREALGKRIGMVVVTVVFIATVKWLGLTLGLLLGMMSRCGSWVFAGRRSSSGSRRRLRWCVTCFSLPRSNPIFPHGPLENLFAAVLKRT